MHDTRWRDDYRRIVKGRSSAYSPRDDGFRINRPIEHVHGNGHRSVSHTGSTARRRDVSIPTV